MRLDLHLPQLQPNAIQTRAGRVTRAGKQPNPQVNPFSASTRYR